MSKKKETTYHFYAYNADGERVNIRTLPKEQQVNIGRRLNDAALRAINYSPVDGSHPEPEIDASSFDSDADILKELEYDRTHPPKEWEIGLRKQCFEALQDEDEPELRGPRL